MPDDEADKIIALQPLAVILVRSNDFAVSIP